MNDAPKASLSREFYISVVVAVVLTVVGAGSAPWWWGFTPWGRATAAPNPNANANVTTFSGGCEPFQVFAQNRWQPLGTAIRPQPNIHSTQIGEFSVNESISVDGWVQGRSAYPKNPAPWNSGVWYHLSDNSGWVSFAGVRDAPTSPDPSGLSDDGGLPAPTNDRCKGSIG